MTDIRGRGGGQLIYQSNQVMCHACCCGSTHQVCKGVMEKLGPDTIPAVEIVFLSSSFMEAHRT